jgi:hypothetical protein
MEQGSIGYKNNHILEALTGVFAPSPFREGWEGGNLPIKHFYLKACAVQNTG